MYTSPLNSDFIWPFLPPYMRVFPNIKMAFIFPISCILVLIFPIFMTYFPKCEGKGSFLKSQIKSLLNKQTKFSGQKLLAGFGLRGYGMSSQSFHMKCFKQPFAW